MSSPSRHGFWDEEFLARLERLHLVAKRVAAHQRSGARRARRIGDGLEFADHRAYAAGDDIRFIDWPYYARMEKLLLRLFHEHSEADVAILLDASGSMAPGGEMAKFDYARRSAAAMAYVAMGSLERVSVAAFADDLGRSVQAGRRREQVFGVLDFLAALEPGGRTDLGRSMERFTRGIDAPRTVLLISDLLDCAEGLSDALARLRRRRCEVTLVHVYSPDDATGGAAGSVLLESAETHRRIHVDAAGEMLEAYRRCWQRFQSGCERTCLSRGATYVAAPTDVPFEQLILGTLRRAGVLTG